MDALIEKHYDYTPYSYVYNNPIRLIDPLGLDSTDRVQMTRQPTEEERKFNQALLQSIILYKDIEEEGDDPVFELEVIGEAGLAAGAKLKVLGIGAEFKLGVSKDLVTGTYSLEEGAVTKYGGEWNLNAALGAGPFGIESSKSLQSSDASVSGNIAIFKSYTAIQDKTSHRITIFEGGGMLGLGGEMKITMSPLAKSHPEIIRNPRVEVQDATYRAPVNPSVTPQPRPHYLNQRNR